MDETRSQITYLYHVNLNHHMNTNKQSGILPTCVNRLVQEIWHRMRCSKLLQFDRCHLKWLQRKLLTSVKKTHSRALRRDKNTVIDQENNIRISLLSAKSIGENKEKLNGLLLSSKNTKF